MSEILLRKAPDHKNLNESQIAEVKSIFDLLTYGPFRKFATEIIADELGPLTVRERWYKASSLGISDETRRNISWQGSPIYVACNVIDQVHSFYPTQIEMADLVVRIGDTTGKKINEPDVETIVKTALKNIYND